PPVRPGRAIPCPAGQRRFTCIAIPSGGTMTVTSGVATGEAARAQTPQQPKRKSLHAGEGRRGLLLVLPALILLAIVIGYPIVRGIVMSLQKDPGYNRATGTFEGGGFAGVQNYTRFLLN